MKYMLGKLPAKPIAFRLRKYLDETALPSPPLRYGHFEKVKVPWGALLNDKISNCTVAGAEHAIMNYAAAVGKVVAFNNSNALLDYQDITGYDPRDPDNTDSGAYMADVADYWRKTGFMDAKGKRHKIDAYASLTPRDWDELNLACYLFTGVGIGIMTPKSAITQFDNSQVWDVASSSVDGGHLIPMMGRNSKGNGICVTWGRLHAFTRAFYEKYNDEAIAYISFDALDSRMMSAEGFDIDTLRKDLKAL